MKSALKKEIILTINMFILPNAQYYLFNKNTDNERIHVLWKKINTTRKVLFFTIICVLLVIFKTLIRKI